VQIDPQFAEARFVLGTALRQTGGEQEGVREQKISVAIQNKKRAAETPNSQSQYSISEEKAHAVRSRAPLRMSDEART
jgi:hypothetical protein